MYQDPALFQISTIIATAKCCQLPDDLSSLRELLQEAAQHAGTIEDIDVQKEQLSLIAETARKMGDCETTSLCPLEFPDVDRVHGIGNAAERRAITLG